MRRNDDFGGRIEESMPEYATLMAERLFGGKRWHEERSMDGTAEAKVWASASDTAPEMEGGARAVGEEGISIIDFGVGEPLAVCGTDGAARRDGGATRPQQAEAVPEKDAGAEMKVVGDALTACATGDRLDEHAAQLGLDGSARFKREKQGGPIRGALLAPCAGIVAQNAAMPRRVVRSLGRRV